MGRSRLLAEAGALAVASGATVIRGLHEDHEGFDGPLVVLLDDVHCSDASDVRRLADLRMRAANVPVVWCTSRRWGRPNSPVDIALASAAGHQRLFRLGALDDRAAQEMAHDLLGLRLDAELTRMVAAVSGHPQALDVLVGGLLDEGKLEAGAVAHLARPALPERFTSLVRRYLQDCSPSSAHMLSVASVAGSRVTFAELAEILGVKPSRLLPDLQEAMVSGLLTEHEDGVRFANELFRCVVLNSIPATARAAVREQMDQYRATRFAAAPRMSDAPHRHPASPAAVKPVRGFMTVCQSGADAGPSGPPRASNAVTRMSDRHAGPSGGALPSAARDRTTIPGWDELSEKQVVIAGLTADGLTNKEMAERLYLSPHTVNYHLRKIFQALSVRSRNDLIRLVHAPAPPPRPLLPDTGPREDGQLRGRGAA
ncbi:LuxR C-terminal-related transcriptional regulator [Streptomyces sp. NPDC004327]|uniref:helix-turn-helix transcriptional regulator n=1 Tax=unclassified Streptomyces TaxID=2593676 RepID=UPI00367A8536